MLLPPTAPSFVPATTIKEAYRACPPDLPLRPGDPRYVEFADWRGGDHLPEMLSERIEWKAFADEDDPTGYERQYVTVLVAGHRGSGKSTELLRLRRKLQNDGYLVVLFDSTKDVDLDDADYADVLLALLFNVVEAATTVEGVTIDPSVLDTVAMNLAQITFEVSDREEVELRLETEFGIGTDLPLFASVRAAFSSLLKSTRETRENARRVVKRRPAQFLADLNLVLNVVNDQLKRLPEPRVGLVVVVDSLDRMISDRQDDGSLAGTTTARQIFLDHADHLKAPDCHLVYTVPISLCYSENVQSRYPDGVEVVPMVKVIDAEGEVCKGGVEVLRKAVGKRIDIGKVFASPDLVDRLCQFSGGNARDLFRLVRYACQAASDGVINSQAVDDAEARLVRDYDLFVKDEDVEKLRRIHRERRLPRDAAFNHLPHQLLVLEYQNATRWADVHPAVQRTSAFLRADPPPEGTDA